MTMKYILEVSYKYICLLQEKKDATSLNNVFYFKVEFQLWSFSQRSVILDYFLKSFKKYNLFYIWYI